MNNKFEGYTIITDLDGTLLNNDRDISKENLDAINYFIENGGRFSVATGRVVEATEEYINKMKVNLPIIVYNGVMIYDYNKKTIVREKFIDTDQKKIIDNVSIDYKDIGIEIYANGKLYVIKDCGKSERSATKMLHIIYNSTEDIFSMNWHKVLFIGETEAVDYLEKTFEIRYSMRGTRSGRTSYELLPINESKGQALKEIISMYNLDSHKVIAIGDNMNDLELLKVAEFSFCPESGSEELKKYADIIAPTNNKHVIQYIVKWLENKIDRK